MHNRTGIRLDFRGMVRNARDLPYENERSNTIGLMLSAKGRKKKLDNISKESKRRTRKEANVSEPSLEEEKNS